VFDSQNNNRGGYNVGNLYYFAGTVIPMEWTNQHTCGNPNNQCEMVIQAMCDDKLRDGTTTNTIPTDPMQCANWDCDGDVRFGRHESLASYKNCQYRERNKGLFNANQQLGGNSAIYTRQNPNGQRRGYECPEERDYYPYWGPTEWKDLAILTNQPRRCREYIKESQNSKPRFACEPPAGWIQMRVRQGATGFIPITQERCELISYTDPTDNITRAGVWKKFEAFKFPDPVCRENAWTRDNHLGNIQGGYPVGFNLTLPADLIHDQCVIRLRYNISTADLGETPNTANWLDQNSIQSSSFLNASLNENRGANQFPALVDVWSKYGLTRAEVADSFDPNRNGNQATLTNSREYVWKNNPKVDIFGSLDGASTMKFQLAINTNQFGRTFQDRTHRLSVKARPENLQGARIHNLNVGGKRGNIVQTYPGTEYDFMPRRLMVRRGDYVHFQWTGSNTNPNNNAGQGRQGSDRHNAIILRDPVYEEGQPVTRPATVGQFGRSYPGRVDSDRPFLGFSQEMQTKLAVMTTGGVGVGQYSGELSELDDAGTYFDLGPQGATRNGIYMYLCTRNNNFSNRDQKGTIVVSDSTANTQALGWAGGVVYGANGVFLSAEEGDLNMLMIVTIENHPPGTSNTMTDVDSDFVDVQPLFFPSLAPGRALKLSIPYNRNAVGRAMLYRADTVDGSYQEYSNVEFESGVATARISSGGWYVVQTQTNWAAVIGVTLAVVVVIGVGAYALFRHMKKRNGGTRV
jgi:hypothetical protein